MARNRQRAKQRQAKRRAARLEQEKRKQTGAGDGQAADRKTPTGDGQAADRQAPTGDGGDGGGSRRARDAVAEPSPAPGVVPPTGVEVEPTGVERDQSGAPPRHEGAYDDDPLLRPREGEMGELTPEEEALEEERLKEDLAEAPDEVDSETLPRTPTEAELGGEVTPRRRDAGRGRPRFVNFLAAVWAELRRVQWPDRPTLITLTWVVLFFVVIMGGYLGGLDAIFSRLVNAIL